MHLIAGGTNTAQITAGAMQLFNTFYIGNGSTLGAINLRGNNGANNRVIMYYQYNSGTGISTSDPALRFYAKDASDANQKIQLELYNGSTYSTIIRATGISEFGDGASFGGNVSVTGSLGISSGMTITGDVTIDGKLSATQKSFLINNPTKPDEKLEYGSLEGAENGVYHRGILTNNYIIELPEEWLWLIDENTITVQLTPFGNYQQIYIDKIKDNKIFINIRGLFKYKNKINCHYIVHAERKDVERLKG